MDDDYSDPYSWYLTEQRRIVRRNKYHVLLGASLVVLLGAVIRLGVLGLRWAKEYGLES